MITRSCLMLILCDYYLGYPFISRFALIHVSDFSDEICWRSLIVEFLSLRGITVSCTYPRVNLSGDCLNWLSRNSLTYKLLISFECLIGLSLRPEDLTVFRARFSCVQLGLLALSSILCYYILHDEFKRLYDPLIHGLGLGLPFVCGFKCLLIIYMYTRLIVSRILRSTDRVLSTTCCCTAAVYRTHR